MRSSGTVEKKELMSKTKRQCVSSQQLQETESTPLNSNDSCREITSTVNLQNSSGNSNNSKRKHTTTKRKPSAPSKKVKKNKKQKKN